MQDSFCCWSCVHYNICTGGWEGSNGGCDGCEKEIKSSCQRQILTSIIDISMAIVIMIFDICALAVQMMAGTACKRFQGGLGRLNKFSEEQFIQPGVCDASEWRKE